MSREASAKNDEKKQNKKIKKSLMKDIKMLLKKKRTKSENMAVNDIRISQKTKSKNHLGIEKNIMKCKKNKKIKKDKQTVKSLNKVSDF